MKLPRKKLAEVFLSYIEGSKNQTIAARKIAAYLIEARRANELDAILREVAALRAQRGFVEINSSSAFPLPGSIKREVAKLFGSKHAAFNEELDENVVGGARFESLDKRLDLTLKRKLDKLRIS